MVTWARVSPSWRRAGATILRLLFCFEVLMNTLSLRWAVGVAMGLGVGALGGCGLISSDVTNFDLTLDKKFTIDMGGCDLNSSARDTYLMRTCSEQNPSFRNTAVQQLCTRDCSGACG